MFLSLAALLALQVVSGSGVSPPDVKGFTPIMPKELEFRIDDYKKAFVGRIVVYQNPNNLSEFIRVYYRQVAIISERAKEKNTGDTGGRDVSLSNLKYHTKQETEVIGRVQQTTDAFAYVQEQTVRDSRTGQDIRTGHRQIWILDSSGVWIYYVQSSNEKSALESSPLSEPSKADPKKRIVVGIKFVLNGTVHIVRVDQDDILTTDKEAADDKK